MAHRDSAPQGDGLREATGYDCSNGFFERVRAFLPGAIAGIAPARGQSLGVEEARVKDNGESASGSEGEWCGVICGGNDTYRMPDTDVLRQKLRYALGIVVDRAIELGHEMRDQCLRDLMQGIEPFGVGDDRIGVLGRMIHAPAVAIGDHVPVGVAELRRGNRGPDIGFHGSIVAEFQAVGASPSPQNTLMPLQSWS